MPGSTGAAALSALSADHRDVLMQTYYAGRTAASRPR